MPTPWWKRAVVYQIYPRSFCDTDGDGIGDLEGIRRHLDHLSWLGVDAVWLSPFYPSPMADFGYDVSDYCDVDPLFGDLDTFDRLLSEAHRRGLRVLVDFVPNHTSDHHPWFLASRSSRDDPKRSWYVWRDPAPDGGPPNNWVASFSPVPTWTFDEHTGQYYLHCFLPEQPELDWGNPEVVAAMHGVVRFWLDRGVDGFRIDVVHLLGKDPELPDDPPELIPIPHVALNDRPETHQILRGLRRLIDSYPGDRMMVGEVYLLDTDLVATYYGAGDELHLSFNFPPLHAPWDADQWRARIQQTQDAFEPRGAWPTWVLSSHDSSRHRTRYGGAEGPARAAAVLLLSLRGTPFLYAGEELGLQDAVIAPRDVVDPGGRDGCRAPIPWTSEPTHGWQRVENWLPWPPDPDRLNVEVERDRPDSMLHLYRRLLEQRRASPALLGGSQSLLPSPRGVVGFERVAGEDRRLVYVNFTSEQVTLEVPAAVVTASSDGVGEGAPFSGTLAGDQAVLLEVTRPDG